MDERTLRAIPAAMRIGDALHSLAPADGLEPFLTVPLEMPGGIRWVIPLTEDGVNRLLVLLGAESAPVGRHLRLVESDAS